MGELDAEAMDWMLMLAGTAVVCLILAGGALSWWGGLSGKLILAASLIYLICCVGVAMALRGP